MASDKIEVLLIEDDEVDRETVRRYAGKVFNITTAATAKEALDYVALEAPDCVIIDYSLPDADGIELIKEFSSQPIGIVMLTGRGDEELAVQAMKRGAHDYLAKGSLTAEGLRHAVRGAVEKVKMLETIREQRLEKDRLIAKLQKALDSIDNMHGLIPICPKCRKVKDDESYQQLVEQFAAKYASVEFSHAYCPECAQSALEGLEEESG